ncbi:MAG TPA: hypothetical protein VGM90_08715 [Kofleriaceae bacterium]|jgi:hypothetical protein
MITFCKRHALAPGVRCDNCEHDYADELPTRRSAKILLAPSVALVAGGLVFGLLLPITFGGAVGSLIMAGLACGTAVSAGAGACRLVERTSRALFLREKAGSLPPARLLPSPRRPG